MKKMLVLLLTLCVLLAACAPANDTPDITGDPSQGTGDSTGTKDPMDDPNPTDDPKDLRLAEFDALFGNTDSWYNLALTSLYTDPGQINLKRLFYSGFPLESQNPTDAERQELKNQSGIKFYWELMRLPVEKMNQVLTQIFGITIEDVDASGFDGLVYLESTNSYYHSVCDKEYAKNFKATRVESMEDGNVRLYYTASSRATEHDETKACVAVLKLVDGQ